MAQFPCDDGAHRYPGAQSTIYPALAQGGKSIRARKRLCSEHYELIMDVAAGAEAVCGTKSWPADCCAPGCDTVTTWSVFLTGYPKGGDREDRYARACDEHAMWLGKRLFLADIDPSDAV